MFYYFSPTIVFLKVEREKKITCNRLAAVNSHYMAEFMAGASKPYGFDLISHKRYLYRVTYTVHFVQCRITFRWSENTNKPPKMTQRETTPELIQ